MKCINNYSKQVYGVKVVRASLSVDAEIEALKLCRGQPYIVNFMEVIKDEAFTYIVTEWLAGVELFEYAIENQLEEDEVRQIFIKIMDAIANMHSQQIIHRDMKLENIKFSNPDPKEGAIKILDFGFACRMADGQKISEKLCYTLEYAAPEIILNKPFDKSCDFWSLGVILYTLLCGHTPFLRTHARENDQKAIKRRIQHASYDVSSTRYQMLSKNAKSLIAELLTVKSERRIGLDRLCRHKWFIENDIHNQKLPQQKEHLENRHRTTEKSKAKEAKRSSMRRVKSARTPVPASTVPESEQVNDIEPELESQPDPEPESEQAAGLMHEIESEPEQQENEPEGHQDDEQVDELEYEPNHESEQELDLDPMAEVLSETVIQKETNVESMDARDGSCSADVVSEIVCIDLSPEAEKDEDDDYVALEAVPSDTIEQDGSTVDEANVDNTVVYQEEDDQYKETGHRVERPATKDAANDLNGIYIAENITTNVENLNNNNEKFIDSGTMKVDEYVNNSMANRIQQKTFENIQADVIVAPKTNGGISPMPMDLFAFIDNDNDTEIDPYEFEDDEEQEFLGFAADDPSIHHNVGRLIDLNKVFLPPRRIHYDEPDYDEYDNEPAWNEATKRKRKISDSSDKDPSWNGRCVPKRLRRRRQEVS